VPRRSLRVLLVAVLSAVLTTGVVLVPTSAGAATRPIGPLSPASRALFGAVVTPSSTPAEVTALEAQIGRKLEIVNHFYTYQEAVGTQGEVQDIAGGRTPMITWGATSTRRIVQGLEDTWIRQQAVRIRDLGAPVFLRYFHEPEGDYRNTMVTTAAEYIAAWKRARQIFASAGATNVVWVFCTTAYSFRVTTTRDPRSFYPGDAFVDWIGADGYNFAPVKPGAKWNSFTTVFSRWYTWAAARPKPLMAAEYGVLEDPSIPGRKAAWYDDMRSVVKTTFPLLQAVVAWSTANTKEGRVLNWNIDSSAASLAAWKRMANDPYFTATT
jgi:Glycosyl hydrolase family 26